MSSSSTSEEEGHSRSAANEDQSVGGGGAKPDEIRPYEGELSEQSDVRVPVTISSGEQHILRDKMKDMFATFITDIDNHVLDVAKSQCELDSQLDKLIETLDSIRIDEKLTRDISENAKRISSLKSRLTVIHTILSDSSNRCSRTLAACKTTTASASSQMQFNQQPQRQQTETSPSFIATDGPDGGN